MAMDVSPASVAAFQTVVVGMNRRRNGDPRFITRRIDVPGDVPIIHGTTGTYGLSSPANLL